MALATTKDIKTQGDLGGQKIAMSLDENSLKHLMSVLSDLYSDPAAAVIREYITNAIDSHIAAGQTRPVEVTGPTRLDQYLKVQDFGLGLDTEDIENIYSKFGASTKRETDTQTGMLGLGSKSALTFTEQFTITAVKNGVKNWTVVSRSADGSGHMEIVSTTQTDEPNGVTIKVPVNDWFDSFNNKMFEFAKYVEPGLITVNGHDTGSWRKNMIEIADGIYVEQSTYSSRDVVVMGNVAYPIDRDKHPRFLSNMRVISHIPMSSVDFTPNREELMYTTLTKNTMSQVIDDFRDKWDSFLSKRLESCTSYIEAFNEAMMVFSEFDSSDVHSLTWQDYSFSRYGNDIHLLTRYNGKIRKTWRRVTKIDTEKTFLLNNFTGKRMTLGQFEKLQKFIEDELELETTDIHILLPAEEHDLNDFYKGVLDDLAEDKHLDWKVIRKIKVENSLYAPKPKKARTYDGYKILADGSGQPVHDQVPDNSKPIFYASKTDLKSSNPGYYGCLVQDDQFFWVISSVEDIFKKRHPTAVHLRDHLEKFVRDYVDNLTPDELALFRQPKRIGNQSMLDFDKVLDPELQALAGQESDTKSDTGKFYAKASKMRDAWMKLPYEVRDKITMPQVTYYESDLAKRYPLMAESHFYSYDKNYEKCCEHLTQYVNMIYTENINKENSAV